MTAKKQNGLQATVPVSYRAAVRVDAHGRCDMAAPISEEMPLTLYLNGKEIVTMLCTPAEERELALGFVVSEGMIGDIADVSSLELDKERGMIWLEAAQARPDVAGRYLKRCLSACCGRGRAEFYFANDVKVSKRVDSSLVLDAAQIDRYARELEAAAATHRLTHGVHCGAVAADGEFVAYSEDIGRHNVFDKLYGNCLQRDVEMNDKAIVFSGRVSSEILLKLSKMAVPIVIARSVPTTLAAALADELGITLIGSAKGDGFMIYSHPQRVRLR